MALKGILKVKSLKKPSILCHLSVHSCHLQLLGKVVCCTFKLRSKIIITKPVMALMAVLKVKSCKKNIDFMPF